MAPPDALEAGIGRRSKICDLEMKLMAVIGEYH